jgi:hypothetical protein
MIKKELKGSLRRSQELKKIFTIMINMSLNLLPYLGLLDFP